MKKRLIYAILVVLLMGLLAGCGNNDTSNANPMDNVMADEDFMFNTSIYVNIYLESFHYGNAQGEAYFELYDEAIQDGGKRLLQAKTDAAGIFEYDLPIAAYKEHLVLYNANKDYFEIEKIDELTGEVNDSYNSAGFAEATCWTYIDNLWTKGKA